MSSNPLVPQPPTLLGNKTQNPTNFNDICQETNTQTEEKKPSVILCHYCFKEQKEYLICKQCKKNFCIDCFNEINKCHFEILSSRIIKILISNAQMPLL